MGSRKVDNRSLYLSITRASCIVLMDSIDATPHTINQSTYTLFGITSRNIFGMFNFIFINFVSSMTIGPCFCKMSRILINLLNSGRNELQNGNEIGADALERTSVQVRHIHVCDFHIVFHLQCWALGKPTTNSHNVQG